MVNPAERLLKLFGSRQAVADEFDVSTESVRLWLKHGIPADRALEVQDATKSLKDPIAATDVLKFLQARNNRAVA
jgi:hypothetical protein